MTDRTDPTTRPTRPTQPGLTARADRRLIRPHARSKRFVLVEVTAPPATQRRERLPVNLAFVLDRSGSMSGQKLELAKQTIVAALQRLDERDRFSVVVYDDVVDLVVESTPASAEARRNALARLDAIDARGSTNLFDGWLRGCEQVAAHLAADGVNRTLLLTDGLANRGTTDPEVIATHAAELRARGVSTTTFGVGTDFDESLLQRIADAGAGHFYYVRDAVTIRDHVTSEVGETLEIVARDVELEVVTAEDVAVEAISPHSVRPRGTRTLVSLGDLVAEQVVDVVLRVTFPYGEIGRETGVIIGLRDRDGVFTTTADAKLAWTYADDRANDAQPRDTDVDRTVARQFAARARQEAVGRNRAGEFDLARSILAATAREIRGYAGSDPELRALANDLETEGTVFAAPMAEANRKRIHFASANIARTRDAQGRSVRRG